MSNCLRVILLLCLSFLGVPAALAAGSSWVATEVGQIRLISALDQAGDADEIPLGLEFALKKGWKIYWRSPGDAGYAPAGGSSRAHAHRSGRSAGDPRNMVWGQRRDDRGTEVGRPGVDWVRTLGGHAVIPSSGWDS